MKKAVKWALAVAMAGLGGAGWAEPGVSAGKITIGQSIGLTGRVASTAQDISAGLKAYITAVNKAGGIHGRQLELRTLDDGFVPKRTAENTRAMLEGGDVFLMAAGHGTLHTLEALNLAEPAGMPLICPFTGADPVRKRFSKVMFHIRATYRDEVEKMVEQFTTLGLQRIAIAYQSDAFGKEGLHALEESLKKRGLQVAAAAPMAPENTDVDAAVRTLKPAQPQAVVMFIGTQMAADLIKKMKVARSFPRFMSISLKGDDEFVAALGEDARGVGHSQVMPYPWNVGMPLIAEYQGAMKAIGKSTFSFNSLEGYVCGKLIGEGLRRAGKAPTRARFIEALETGAYDLGGYELRFSNSKHDGSKFVDLTVVDHRGRFMK